MSKLIIVSAACCAAISGCGGGAAASSPPDLGRLFLRAAQVGPGYHSGPQHLTLSGPASGGPCGAAARSESLRVARIYGVFTDHELPKAERVGVRNEVIAYASGGAKQTMRELQHLGSGCPPSYHVTPITDANLLPGYIARKTQVLADPNGEAHELTSIWIYQSRGDVVSEIFAAVPEGRESSALVPVALHAAEESARNLAR
jgi:hypothetical protein